MRYLTQEKADEIRSRYAAGGVTQAALGEEFGVTPGAISRIVNHASWTTYTPYPTSGVRGTRTKEQVLAGNLRRNFGLDYDEYLRMVAAQENKCLICGNEPNGERLSVDHCHTTGAIRGLLCRPCNTLLGMAKDDPTILARAIDYLTVEVYTT